ncbi:gcn5-related n-acetyltransferase [Grosmannia clavigera kw1407]|uniref:Gcn5-related n-acetyltransferase n=1 Tax=Grosmannia clavigera (strain kw1407 / UAMH 11150) TaxID=655863 RepID=F0XIU4_GROCL|nr:gcn5-related n-acetyltransferase [Grosmannia clavigera kw1407]EFX02327.1 gcn5-related n-acetyltransferase [Grosmannia clavigera kw1407]
MALEKPIVRFARREDVPTVLQLIFELAEYEHEVDSVKATEEKLLQTIAFAPSVAEATAGHQEPTEPTTSSRPARCLLVVAPDGDVAGLALYYYNYSTWHARPGIYLEDLFVRPAHRKKGYGHVLLETLAKEVVAMGGGRLEWSVLKWNAPSIKFYESLGAKTMSEWSVMRVDGDSLLKLAGDGS